MLNTKLTVVNDMLGLLGELPVNDLDSFHPMVPRALQTLETTSGDIQSRQWWFNTETVELQPQSDSKYIMLPNNTLSVDTVSPRPATTQRGNRLYNLDDNTFEFDAPVTVRLRMYFDFDELPNAARAYIAAEAMMRFQNTIDGDDAKTRRLMQQVKDAKAELQAEHTRQIKANMLRRNGPIQLMLLSKYNRAHMRSRYR